MENTANLGLFAVHKVFSEYAERKSYLENDEKRALTNFVGYYPPPPHFQWESSMVNLAAQNQGFPLQIFRISGNFSEKNTTILLLSLNCHGLWWVGCQKIRQTLLCV
jgi:hypothetical protein